MHAHMHMPRHSHMHTRVLAHTYTPRLANKACTCIRAAPFTLYHMMNLLLLLMSKKAHAYPLELNPTCVPLKSQAFSHHVTKKMSQLNLPCIYEEIVCGHGKTAATIPIYAEYTLAEQNLTW